MHFLTALTSTSRLLRYSCFVTVLGVSTPGHSQGVVPTMGTEFWLGFMKNYQGNPNQSLDIFISSYTLSLIHI